MHNPPVKVNKNLFKSDILKSVAPTSHLSSSIVPSADGTLSPVRSRKSSFKVFRNSRDAQDSLPCIHSIVVRIFTTLRIKGYVYKYIYPIAPKQANEEGSDGDSSENLLLLTPMKKSIDEIEPIVRKIGSNSRTGVITCIYTYSHMYACHLYHN